MGRGQGWRTLLLAFWLVLAGAADAAPKDTAADTSCEPHILHVQMAIEGTSEGVRPVSDWHAVALPHNSYAGRSDDDGRAIWYRIDWTRPCQTGPVALAVDGINMAGEIYVGDALLWRDQHLTEPMSRSWNTPRQWLIASDLLHGATPPIWVRVKGVRGQGAGLRRMVIGTPATVDAHYERQVWLQRTAHFANLIISGVLGFIFLFIWLARRDQVAYAWFALMSLFWVLFMSNILATQSWPFTDGVIISRVNVSALLFYVACMIQFIRHFECEDAPGRSNRPSPFVRKMLGRSIWVPWTLALAALWAVDARQLQAVTLAAGGLAAVLFLGACLFGMSRAWRSAHAENRLMAVCLLGFAVLCIHDFLAIQIRPDSAFMLTPYAAPLTTLSMAAVLGWRISRNARRIERFNEELGIAIADAREELRSTLARQHTLALDNARLQERLRIAHDLHDGLGGSLVRAMAWVEQSIHAVRGEQMMSMLKVFRDDLRQVVDTSSSHGLVVPATPVDWGAPLRHRFTRLFDELGIQGEWHFPAHWEGQPPDTLPCLVLMRVAEEAMTNILKHSRARHVCLRLEQPDETSLALSVEDDGVGFDVAGVLRAGLSTGMRSMQDRVARAKGTLNLHSRPGRTRIEVSIPCHHSSVSANFQDAPLS